MALSIRNPLAEKLAREVAQRSGESITGAIIHALEEHLQRLKGKKTTENLEREIMKISKRCSSLPKIDARDADDILGYGHEGHLD